MKKYGSDLIDELIFLVISVTGKVWLLVTSYIALIDLNRELAYTTETD